MENENILCISYTTWDGPYTKSVVQLLSRLARQNKILFVEYPFTLKDAILGFIKKGDSPYKRIWGWESRIQIKRTDIGTEIYTYIAPPIIPTNFIRNESLFRIIHKINTAIFNRSVKKTLATLKMNKPVVVNAYNCYFGVSMIGKMDEKTNIYYCYDGMATDRHGNRALVYDEAFSKKADAVIVSSDYLFEEKSKWNSNAFVVKNGVDFDLFAPFAKKTISKNAQKKVGYIGSVDQRFDIEKVAFAVKNLPLVDFEFVGDLRNKAVFDELSKYKNVQFLPPIPSSEVPKLLSSYDAGIIPYIINDINKNVYPLKLNEYLAVGVPVVLTQFANLPEFEDFASFANTKEQFLDLLSQEIENDSNAKIIKRIAFAKENSWENRAHLFEQAIENSI